MNLGWFVFKNLKNLTAKNPILSMCILLAYSAVQENCTSLGTGNSPKVWWLY